MIAISMRVSIGGMRITALDAIRTPGTDPSSTGEYLQIDMS